MRGWLKRTFGGKDEGATGALASLRSQIVGAPLAIDPAKLDAFLASLATTRAPKAISDGAAQVGIERPAPTVARIPVHGVLVQRSMGELFDWWFGVTSYDRLREQIAEAAADENVREIVLDIDSPGGMVAGLHALTDFIAKVRDTKDVTAIVNEFCASAAYQIAAACTRIIAPKTAMLGSIGVVSTHVDWSARNSQSGIKITHIYRGERKLDWSRDLPLSAEAHAAQQARIDQFYEMFVGAVARYRGIDEQVVRDTEASIYLAGDALALGLVDEVATAEEALAAAVARLDTPEGESVDPEDEDDDEEEPSPPSDDDDKDDEAELEDENDEEDEEDEPTSRAPKSGEQRRAPRAHAGSFVRLSARELDKRIARQVRATRKAERSRAAEIAAICATFGASATTAHRLVASGASLDEVRRIASAEGAHGTPQTFNAVDPYDDADKTEDPILSAMRRRVEKRSKR